ncbi:hypothetical protein G7Y89_g3554 [Cudoniella acicularis]|uniref:Uncharacterized protein n=1 Tax=Cudoniella acicularis TaxID=354080 RepID=A0A8H4RR53_9HELO|nr:hypothetical protein G7Y89_g3554 [Cudoniella acicularis]
MLPHCTGCDVKSKRADVQTNFQRVTKFTIALDQVTFTWDPTDLGPFCPFPDPSTDFRMNWWIHRADNPGQVPSQTVLYSPFLLAANQSSHNNTGVLWTPVIGDLDYGDAGTGIHNGSHQFAWETFAANPKLDPNNVTTRCYSVGFNVVKSEDVIAELTGNTTAATVSTTSSTSNPTPSSTLSTTSTPISLNTAQTGVTGASTQSPSSSSTPQSMIVGLSVSLTILGLISIAAIIFGFRFLKKRREKRWEPSEMIIYKPEINSDEVSRDTSRKIERDTRSIEVGQNEAQEMHMMQAREDMPWQQQYEMDSTDWVRPSGPAELRAQPEMEYEDASKFMASQPELGYEENKKFIKWTPERNNGRPH